MAEIKSVDELLKMDLDIPLYQRPYKWDIQNIEDLFLDISNAISDRKKYGDSFKYRIGTILLHKNKEGKHAYDIVDGQQRIISLVLMKLYLQPGFTCSILEKNFTSKTTQYNIHRNYTFISEWFSLNHDVKGSFIKAFAEILEVIVISVDEETEAFQLFDSQNTRGKELYPHDLLKAYHLREMKHYPYEMEHAVTKWEAKDSGKIKELFDLYLFPIWAWSRGNKSRPFTAKEIDTYKGLVEGSTYTYARRASKASPLFQITEPFIAGNDFFEMVDHYLNLLKDIKTEICNNQSFKELKSLLCNEKGTETVQEVKTVEEMDNIKHDSAGFRYVINLFYCALLCYYDKFHNFDQMAVKKLFIWAFMLRVDMEHLGFDSVNKYAVGGDDNSRYTNKIGIFSKISMARMHYEISSLQIEIKKDNPPASTNWIYLYNKLKELKGDGRPNE